MAQYKIEMDNKGTGYNLMVRHGEIKFKNFRGRPTKPNPQGGVRSVSIIIDSPRMYHRLLEDGWRFKTDKIDPDDDNSPVYEPFAEKENGDIAYPWTDLAIRFHHQEGEEWRDPKFRFHTQDGDVVLFREEELDKLDTHYITDFKMKIRPSKNMKGYLNEMDFWLQEDEYESEDGWDDWD